MLSLFYADNLSYYDFCSHSFFIHLGIKGNYYSPISRQIICYRLTHIKFPGSKKHVGYVKSRCKTTWQTDVKFSSVVILVTKRFPFPVLTQFSDFLFFKSSIQFHEYVSLIDQKDSETKLLRRRSKFHQECMYLPTYVQFHGLVKTSSHHCAIHEKILR